MCMCMCSFSVYDRWGNWCQSAGLTARLVVLQLWGWRRAWRRCWSPKTSKCDRASRERSSHHPRLVTANGTAPLRLANRRKGGKRVCEWWDNGKLTGMRMSDGRNGGQGARKMRGGRFIMSGEIWPPIVWVTSTSECSGCAFHESWVVVRSSLSRWAGTQGQRGGQNSSGQFSAEEAPPLSFGSHIAVLYVQFFVPSQLPLCFCLF